MISRACCSFGHLVYLGEKTPFFNLGQPCSFFSCLWIDSVIFCEKLYYCLLNPFGKSAQDVLEGSTNVHSVQPFSRNVSGNVRSEFCRAHPSELRRELSSFLHPGWFGDFFLCHHADDLGHPNGIYPEAS